MEAQAAERAVPAFTTVPQPLGPETEIKRRIVSGSEVFCSVRIRIRRCVRSLHVVHVTHCADTHLISLSTEEAASLVEACALLLLAANSVPDCRLRPEMAVVLAGLYEQFSGHIG
jgi:hypothetical protein